MRSRAECYRLGSEIARLERKIGSLNVKDPGRIYVAAMDCNQPFEFAWHVYLPANYNSWLYKSFGQGSGASLVINSGHQEFIARLKIKVKKEQLIVVSHFGGGSSFVSGNAKNPLFKPVLSSTTDGLNFQCAGSHGVESFAIDDEVVFLAITDTNSDAKDNSIAPLFIYKLQKRTP
ncbi:MAG: hypothetical protein ABL921_07140 [Pirellula sp.]